MFTKKLVELYCLLYIICIWHVNIDFIKISVWLTKNYNFMFIPNYHIYRIVIIYVPYTQHTNSTHDINPITESLL